MQRIKIRVIVQGGAKNGFGFVQSPQGAEHGAQIVAGADMVGGQFDRALVFGFGFIEPPVFHIDIAQIVVGVHVFGCNLDGF